MVAKFVGLRLTKIFIGLKMVWVWRSRRSRIEINLNLFARDFSGKHPRVSRPAKLVPN